MPFLDLELVDYSISLPPKTKLYGQERIEKWVLRKAFEGQLPEEILWREKAEFAQGAGSEDYIKEIIESRVSDEEFQKYCHETDPPLRSKEEMYYYQIFKQYFKNRSAAKTVGRWAKV